MQRWGFASLILERKVQEFVEGVVRLGPEPGEETVCVHAGAEQPSVETERRFAACAVGDLVERARDIALSFAQRGA